MKTDKYRGKRELPPHHGVGVDTAGAHVEHVVVHAGGAHGGDLERLQRARRSHHRVGGGDGGYDVLHHPLRVRVRHASDHSRGRFPAAHPSVSCSITHRIALNK